MFSFLKKFSKRNSDFESSFFYLKNLGGSIQQQGDKVYELLRELSKNSSDDFSETLVSEFYKLRFTSNTNEVFFFYFPIVSHILYFKPACEKEILRYLVGPIFANGTEDGSGVIHVIEGSMNFKLKENPNYLTKESQQWVKHTLPTMITEVQREVDIHSKELDD